MSGKKSRDKGHSFERQIVRDFKAIGYAFAERALAGTKSDQDGIDIIHVEPFEPQCKRYKDYAPLSKIEEVKTRGGIPLLITKGDRKDTLVAMKWSDFLKLIKRNETSE